MKVSDETLVLARLRIPGKVLTTEGPILTDSIKWPSEVWESKLTFPAGFVEGGFYRPLILKEIFLLEARVIDPFCLGVRRPKIMSIELAVAFVVHYREDLIRTRPEQLKELVITILLGRKILILSPY